MRTPFDSRFFKVLADVATELLGPDHPSSEASRSAADTDDPLLMRAARQSLDTLPPDTHERLMAETHRRLATDLSAIWDNLPGALPGGRMN
ncbi:hypothetical protein [Antarctobacter jejuensis]|uniref:hypothetical protein n=1 Tax=Antarctobacter jejuensis TaxID=1439938 RepID=UPI003FD11024